MRFLSIVWINSLDVTPGELFEAMVLAEEKVVVPGPCIFQKTNYNPIRNDLLHSYFDL
ncbi:MAG: hypothetical protein IH874_09475 [Candidatus Dadabacteria bacterium]|nr:hypothetical protein [Candidatus Dadabacteria bacterium]